MIRATIRAYRAEFGTARLLAEAAAMAAVAITFTGAWVALAPDAAMTAPSSTPAVMDAGHGSTRQGSAR